MPYQERYPWQYYIVLIYEPASFSGTMRILQQLPDGFFNLTMTYRKDSDLSYSYYKIVKRPYQLPVQPVVNMTRKYIAWFVSNCATPSKREVYVSELSKHIPVDIFGACGPLKCGKHSGQKCYKILEENYLFYLSFENSFCKDYVSEKLGRILQLNVVPIVLGGANYSDPQVAPPHSVIEALSFKSPRDLAEYLITLSKNRKKYRSYFEWKRNYTVSNTQLSTSFCKLCRLLHKPVRQRHVVYNITQWWAGNGTCRKSSFMNELAKQQGWMK